MTKHIIKVAKDAMRGALNEEIEATIRDKLDGNMDDEKIENAVKAWLAKYDKTYRMKSRKLVSLSVMIWVGRKGRLGESMVVFLDTDTLLVAALVRFLGCKLGKQNIRDFKQKIVMVHLQLLMIVWLIGMVAAAQWRQLSQWISLY